MSRDIIRIVNSLRWGDTNLSTKPIHTRREYLGFTKRLNNKKYVVLLLEHFYKIKDLRKLARILNSKNILVLFQTPYQYRSKKQEIKVLKKVASCSQDDIKTAIVNGELTNNNKILSSLYTYNQLLNSSDKPLHAEQILVEYIVNSGKFKQHSNNYWQSLLEPCYNCLRSMSDIKSTELIEYIKPHKAKWNTKDYYRLVELLGDKYKPLRSKR